MRVAALLLLSAVPARWTSCGAPRARAPPVRAAAVRRLLAAPAGRADGVSVTRWRDTAAWPRAHLGGCRRGGTWRSVAAASRTAVAREREHWSRAAVRGSELHRASPRFKLITTRAGSGRELLLLN